MMRPRLLDLFCCAGGAAMGYARAGFDVVGVDNRPQPRYPFAFIQADALDYVAQHGHEYDAIHASPPCQGYSLMQRMHGHEYPMHVEEVRRLLLETGKPYVIENVKGAPLVDPTTLVGSMFGLLTMRPRLFESNILLPFMLAPSPSARHAKLGIAPKEGEYVHVVGHAPDVEYNRKAMGIDWMTRDELSQAIPPAYTEWIGRHLMSAVMEAQP